jgi:hypothetical protein
MSSLPLVPRAVAISSAQQGLALSRSQIAQWLEREHQAPPAPSTLGCAVRSALPLFGGLRAHPATAVVLGALAQAWLRPDSPTPATVGSRSPQWDIGITFARRHPATSLLAVGLTGLALWWWSRSSNRQTPR